MEANNKADYMYDKDGQHRGVVVALKDDEIGLKLCEQLFQLYKLRVSRMSAVQSYSPNLVQFKFDEAGFPHSSHAEIPQTVTYFGEKIKQALKGIGYCSDDQNVMWYLSLMRSLYSTVQPPHIDFKWDSVSKVHIEANTNKRRNSYKDNYREYVPFIGLLPLTEEGMTVEIWNANTTGSSDLNSNTATMGCLVHISFGHILLLRGDVVHAGGFVTAANGNPRSHFYFYKTPRGEQHDMPLSNSYSFPDKSDLLSKYYIHCWEEILQLASQQTLFQKHVKRSKRKEKNEVETIFNVPEPPQNDGSVVWKYNKFTRIYDCDLSKLKAGILMSRPDKEFLAKLLERDDIVVVVTGILSDGLLGGVSEETLLSNLASSAFRNRKWNKIRRYEKSVISNTNISHYQEVKGDVSMISSEYLKYLKLHKQQFQYGDSSNMFEFEEIRNGCRVTKTMSGDDAKRNIFYMYDIEAQSRLKDWCDDYQHHFKIPEMLPGGPWCMMNSLPESARPHLGPNVYICPGGGYTMYHRDGFGTVDSVHSCLSGYNEVFILRRLSHDQVVHACSLLPPVCKDKKETNARADAILFGLPHADNDKLLECWPQYVTLETLYSFGYCPIWLTLKAGQSIMLNKGRLHAFRKLSIDVLPEYDCHYFQRKTLMIENPSMEVAPICISVAFDWQYMGYTSQGIKNEVTACLDSAYQCQKYNVQPLGFTKTALLHWTDNIPIDMATVQSMLPAKRNITNCGPTWKAVAEGTLSSLEKLVEEELRIFYHQRQTKNDDRSPLEIIHQRRKRKSKDDDRSPLEIMADACMPIDIVIDLDIVGTQDSLIDPFGNDYHCQVCKTELPNSYYHCLDCENLLSSDFNICQRCFNEPQKKHCVEIETTQSSCQHKDFQPRCRFFKRTDLETIIGHCRVVDKVPYIVTTDESLVDIFGSDESVKSADKDHEADVPIDHNMATDGDGGTEESTDNNHHHEDGVPGDHNTGATVLAETVTKDSADDRHERVAMETNEAAGLSRVLATTMDVRTFCSNNRFFKNKDDDEKFFIFKCECIECAVKENANEVKFVSFPIQQQPQPHLNEYGYVDPTQPLPYWANVQRNGIKKHLLKVQERHATEPPLEFPICSGKLTRRRPKSTK